MSRNIVNNKNKKLISKKNIISFDIFDTLIYRNCLHHTYIFKYVEKRYNKISNKRISDFTSKRRNAAILAKEKYNVEEATYDQIYDCFDDKYDVELLKKLEIEVEFDFCVANNDIKPLYDYAKKHHKRIICISDMYYDSNTLQRLLKKCGYDIKEIYVSSEYNKKKSTRKLFKELLRLGKFESKDIVHVGDAEKGDFLFPKMLGIKTILVKKNKNNIYLSNKKIDLSELDNNLIYSVTNNNIVKDKYYRFGHEVIGPVCLYYLLWLNKQCSKNNYKMLFCARDMKMLYEMYNILFPLEKERTEYFYVSRRSLRMPYLYKNNSYEHFLKSITDNKLEIKQILENMNLLTDKIKKYIDESNLFDQNQKFSKESFAKDNRSKILYDTIINETICNIGDNQYKYLIEYLSSISVDRFYLIDMGWKGTTQSILKQLLPKQLIKGFYFGIDNQSNYKEINNNTTSEYLFYKNDNYVNDIQTIIYSFRDLFEKLFASQTPTTIQYGKDEPYYILDKKINIDVNIEKIQEGAVNFIKKISRYNDYFSIDNSYEYINVLIYCFTFPSLTFAKHFGEIINDNMYNRKMASPKSLFYYLFHPRKLKVDIGKSGWKIGFMKRLFKIKLPYWNIYKKAYEMKKKGE